MRRLLSLIVPTCLIAFAAHAQQPEQPPAASMPGVIGQQQPGPAAAPQLPPHIIVQGIPGVQQTPAPDWIKPGMRLAFLSASASVASNPNDQQLIEDPNGDIVDERGRRWRETDYISAGSGGAGYNLVNVVAVEPGVIVMQSDMYLLVNGTTGPSSLVSSTGFWCHPSGCDYFLHPRLLAQLQPIDRQGFSIMRHSYNMSSQRFNAVRITNNGGGRSTYVYDLSSGALLSSNSSSVSQGGQVFRDGYIVPTSGQIMSITRFISARDLQLPWAAASQMPNWVRTAKRLRYAGARITRSPANLGTPDFSIGLQVTAETSYLGQTFAVYKITTQPQSPSDIPGANDPSTAVGVCGPGSLGGIWMDPAALRQLQVGQVIDRDPTTGVTTSVEAIGQGVTITCASQAQKTAYTYDASSGALVAMSKSDYYPETGFTNVTTLQLTGMQ